MRRFLIAVTAGGACVLVLAALSVAAPKSTVWTAALSSGKEVPAQVVKDAPAHGLFKGTLTGNSLKFTLTFAKLTGPATASHIHLGAAGVSGAPVVYLCSTSPAAPPTPHCTTSPVTGTVTVSATLQQDFKKHLLYVNVHTGKNPMGEIRGQLAVG